MFRLKSFLVSTVCVCGLSLGAWAASGSYPVQLVVNDRIISNTGTVIDGCTFVPLRTVIEAMGGSVQADPKSGTVTAATACNTAEFKFNDRHAVIDQRHIMLYRAPRIIDGAFCVPLRFFVDSCGARVDVTEKTKAAFIYSSDYRYAQAAANPIKAVFFSPRRDLVSGETVNFEVAADPASHIVLDIPGVRNGIPAYEDRPGRFLASLTVTDDMRAENEAVTARISSGGPACSLQSKDLISVNAAKHASAADSIKHIPAGNAVIANRHPNIVLSFPSGSLKQETMRLWFDDAEYSHQLVIRRDSASWRPAEVLGYSKHHVRFTAEDMEGRTAVRDWFFSVAPSLNTITDSVVQHPPILRVRSPRSGDGVNSIMPVIGRASAHTEVSISIRECGGQEQGIVRSPFYTESKKVMSDITGRFAAEFDISAVRAGTQLIVEVSAVDQDGEPGEPIVLTVKRR